MFIDLSEGDLDVDGAILERRRIPLHRRYRGAVYYFAIDRVAAECHAIIPAGASSFSDFEATRFGLFLRYRR